MSTRFGSNQHQFVITHSNGRTTVRRHHVPTGLTFLIADLFFDEWLATLEILESDDGSALPPGWRGLNFNDRPLEYQRFARHWLEHARCEDLTTEVARRHYTNSDRDAIRRDVLLHVSRGGTPASWLRENPHRVSRSVLYRILSREKGSHSKRPARPGRHLFLVA